MDHLLQLIYPDLDPDLAQAVLHSFAPPTLLYKVQGGMCTVRGAHTHRALRMGTAPHALVGARPPRVPQLTPQSQVLAPAPLWPILPEMTRFINCIKSSPKGVNLP